jgi:hypothetical protein
MTRPAPRGTYPCRGRCGPSSRSGSPTIVSATAAVDHRGHGGAHDPAAMRGAPSAMANCDLDAARPQSPRVGCATRPVRGADQGVPPPRARVGPPCRAACTEQALPPVGERLSADAYRGARNSLEGWHAGPLCGSESMLCKYANRIDGSREPLVWTPYPVPLRSVPETPSRTTKQSASGS